MYRTNHGFTLIELLVVITIIGVLIALLIPGVNMAREQSRQTKCLNNEIQIGKAFLTYEVSKGHLPGVLNQVQLTGGTVVQYSWLEALFPFLDRSDLWIQIHANNLAGIANERLAIAVCPNDPYLVDPTSSNANALLSYGVNDNFFVSYTTNPPSDRSGKSAAPAILSKLTGRPNATFPRGQTCVPSTTIMLAERTGDARPIVSPATTVYYPQTAGNFGYGPGKWTDTGWGTLTFIWPTTSTQLSPSVLVSNHPGIVCAVFFDGSGQKLSNDATFPQ